MENFTKCAYCKKDIFPIEKLFCGKDCLDKWEQSLEKSNYEYGD